MVAFLMIYSMWVDQERVEFCLQTVVIGSRSTLALSAHPTYFDLTTPLNGVSPNHLPAIVASDRP